MKISRRTVDALQWTPPGPSQQFIWDTEIRGFGAYVIQSGRKTYVVRLPEGFTPRQVKLGDAYKLTPDQARDAARRIFGRVAIGDDPLQEAPRRRAKRTVRDVGEQWLSEHVDQLRKPRTAEEYRRLFDLHIFPAIGALPLRDLKRSDMSTLRSAMRDRPIAANRALSVFSAFWNWAAKHGECDEGNNPARGVEKYKEKARERFLSTDELTRLGDVLRLAETDGLPWDVDETSTKAKHLPKAENRREVLDPFAIAAIRLLLLTGARLTEILTARWDELDLERSLIALADSKTGAKPIFLSGPAREVLASLPRFNGNPYIIAGAKPGAHRSDLSRPWRAIRRAAGLDGLRLHDLRHSFASVGAGAQLGLPVIGRLLGHAQPRTTARYAHLADDPVRAAADTIGATISDALDGRTRNRRKQKP